MSFLAEADLEPGLLDQLRRLGYGIVSEAAIDRINPHIPSEARQDAPKQIVVSASPSLFEENRRLHANASGLRTSFDQAPFLPLATMGQAKILSSFFSTRLASFL